MEESDDAKSVTAKSNDDKLFVNTIKNIGDISVTDVNNNINDVNNNVNNIISSFLNNGKNSDDMPNGSPAIEICLESSPTNRQKVTVTASAEGVLGTKRMMPEGSPERVTSDVILEVLAKLRENRVVSETAKLKDSSASMAMPDQDNNALLQTLQGRVSEQLREEEEVDREQRSLDSTLEPALPLAREPSIVSPPVSDAAEREFLSIVGNCEHFNFVCGEL